MENVEGWMDARGVGRGVRDGSNSLKHPACGLPPIEGRSLGICPPIPHASPLSFPILAPHHGPKKDRSES